jgi:hypothetical protein
MIAASARLAAAAASLHGMGPQGGRCPNPMSHSRPSSPAAAASMDPVPPGSAGSQVTLILMRTATSERGGTDPRPGQGLSCARLTRSLHRYLPWLFPALEAVAVFRSGLSAPLGMRIWTISRSLS